MTVISFLLFLLIGYGHVYGQECLGGGTEDGPQLPTFPDQFSAEIEANVLHLNLTLHVTEYYDNINERGRIEAYSQFSNNVTLVNYGTMEVSHIVTINGSKSCTAAPLSANSSRFARAVFGAQFVNGTAHIGTPSQFLRFGEEFNETYIGMEIVRGIPCHRWQSCNISEGSPTNYTTDYYFTQDDWTPSMIPVQIVVNGTRPNNDGTIHQVLNVYSFVNFRPGPADDNLFRVPPGQPCLGRVTGKALPPLPEDYYSALYEVTYSTFSIITYVREYYSYSQQLYRLDFDQSFVNSTAIIEDFNEGVRYNINSRYGSCTVIPINATNSIATEVGDDGIVHLQTITNHFQRQAEYNYTYEGLSKVRRVDTESWISLRDREVFNNYSVLTNGYVQVFYTLPSWNISYGDNKSSNVSVPWRFVLAGNFSLLSQEKNSTYFVINEEVLEFRTEEPDFDVFDVSVCYSVDQYTILRLTLPLPDDVTYTSLDHSLLRSRVRSALSQAANVSASRLGGINILERSNDSLLLNLHVLDPPAYSRNTNAVSRDEVVSLLMEKVNGGEVIITLGELNIVPLIRSPPNTTCPYSVQPTMTIVSMTTPITVSKTTSLTVSTASATAGVSMTTLGTNATTSTTGIAPPIVSVQSSMATVSETSPIATLVLVSTVPCPTSTCSVIEESSSNSLSSGATAGLTVTVFIVGVIVGVISTVLSCWIMRNRGKYSTSSLAYNKQRDDVVI